MSTISFVCLGNPENRRLHFFQRALSALGLPEARVVSYLELLDSGGDLRPFLRPGEILRIESPGENFAVHQRILAIGASLEGNGAAQRIDAARALVLEDDRGLISYPHQWFLGFRQLMQDLQRQLAGRQGALMTDPGEVLAMFDKAETHRRLREAALPVPSQRTDIGSYEQLREFARSQEHRRFFAKLRYGSSASGVVAFRFDQRHPSAITSAEMVWRDGQLRLYNSLRLRRYSRPRDLEALFDALAREDVVVETWIPKARTQGGVFDLRIVAIGAQAQHAVLRLSQSPMTNLHLGNRRGDLEAFVQDFGPESWQATRQRASQALACFPNAHYAGVDVLLHAREHSPVLLEVNAFGDLLPGVAFQGEDTYTAQIRLFLEQGEGA